MKYLYLFVFSVMLFNCKPMQEKNTNSEPQYNYDVEQKIQDLGIALQTPKAPKGANIVRAVRSGNLLFLSGKGPTKPDGTNVTGKVGLDLDEQQGYAAARLVAINQLSVLKAELGDLHKVKRVVKVFGMVNATPEFTKHSQVINGFSDLFIEVFGDRGKHARAAVGMVSLPGDISVEVDMVVEIDD